MQIILSQIVTDYKRDLKMLIKEVIMQSHHHSWKFLVLQKLLEAQSYKRKGKRAYDGVTVTWCLFLVRGWSLSHIGLNALIFSELRKWVEQSFLDSD